LGIKELSKRGKTGGIKRERWKKEGAKSEEKEKSAQNFNKKKQKNRGGGLLGKPRVRII